MLKVNSKADYRESLEAELKEVRESEMWRIGKEVRKLRPENQSKPKAKKKKAGKKPAKKKATKKTSAKVSAKKKPVKKKATKKRSRK